ncbi:hypothetical protein HUS84_12290 [Pseudomonas chlororaphis]|uniref:hypothetical protein n=1 Tax=Pseudomonas chlororaphis TaxID=587753 RepID=UPI001B326F47|nr:hypothetical protein [Pseudomonas chlororaphis]MBP5074765.1 hypothetical protein [Pseudomonas chlororaphis]
MGIQLDREVNLKDAGVFAWLKAGAYGPHKETINDQKLGLSLVQGSEREVIGNAVFVTYFAANQRKYDLIQVNPINGHERKIQSMSVLIPLEYRLKVELETVLYIAETALNDNQRNGLLTEYKNYPAGEDPLIYAAEAIKRLGINSDQFQVFPRYILSRDSGPVAHMTEANALEGFYSSSVVNGDSEWFTKHKIFLKLVSEEFYGEYEQKKEDPTYEPQRNGRSDDEVLDEVEEIMKKGLNCDKDYESVRHPVMTLLVWPEYKVEWYMQGVRIGCVTVYLSLPVLKTRRTEQILYANAVLAKNSADATAIQIIEESLLEAALLGAVVGVYLWNLSAAVAAFKVSFEKLVVVRLVRAISCLDAELTLIKKSTGWQ